jgi:hypothetical protein
MANWNAIAIRVGMIGSEYDGEVLAAANALKRCLKAEGITCAAFSFPD